MDADAGSESGELFGYKIGDKYPVKANTLVKKRLSVSDGSISSYILEIVTESPIKPKEIHKVSVSTTVQTFTIIDIISCNEFDSYEKADDFADKYTTLLKAKYPETKNDAFLLIGEEFSTKFNNEYILTIKRYSNGKHTVRIHFRAIGDVNKRLNCLKDKEYNAALQLDATKPEVFLDGM